MFIRDVAVFRDLSSAIGLERLLPLREKATLLLERHSPGQTDLHAALAQHVDLDRPFHLTIPLPDLLTPRPPVDADVEAPSAAVPVVPTIPAPSSPLPWTPPAETGAAPGIVVLPIRLSAPTPAPEPAAGSPAGGSGGDAPAVLVPVGGVAPAPAAPLPAVPVGADGPAPDAPGAGPSVPPAAVQQDDPKQDGAADGAAGAEAPAGAPAPGGASGPVPPLPALEPLSLSWTAEAGRVVTLSPLGDLAGEVSEVRITGQGAHGHVSVNAEHSLALVLSRDPGQTDTLRFQYEITHADGRIQQAEAEVDLTPASQQAGWGQGNFYMLEEAADGRIVVEHGDNHRKVYVTGSSDGLSRAEIAQAEGVAPGEINGGWLERHPEYGASPETALSTELGMELWFELTWGHQGPTSHWLLFERGYDYEGTGRLISRGAQGESELHPVYVGAFGEGSAPRIADMVNVFQELTQNVVIQDLEFNGGFQSLFADNLLLNDVTITRAEMNIQNSDGFTFRNSSIIDVARDAPVNDGSTWQQHANRTSGAYIEHSTGVLIENTFADRNGWAEGYDYNLSADAPMPPSMYSHNYYLQYNNVDVTFRDNIVMRAASIGAQIRPGGVIEGNVFLDNNVAVNALGGSKESGPTGNFTLMADNVVTSAGYREVAEQQGALSMGIEVAGRESTLLGNIVAHISDPNNPDEVAAKRYADNPNNVHSQPAYDDTIVFNWSPYSPNGVAGAARAGAEGRDATTIQNFTAQILGRESATIADLADLLRAQAAGQLDHVVDADLITAYFQQGFGIAAEARSLGTMHRFQPSDLGDGMRWDNRLNWTSGELPGADGSASIDLAGNDVIFGARTVTVDDFVFGDFGRLTVTSGRLNIAGGITTSETGADLVIERAGQVWVDGHSGAERLEVSLSGGRFANAGDMTGNLSLTAGGNGQALLATPGGSFELLAGSNLTVVGGRGKVGFDGADAGTAVLRLQEGATTEFVGNDSGLGRISEFRSGAFGETSAVTSGIRLDGLLSVDVTGFDSKAGGNWTLIEADQIVGLFDDVTVEGLAADQDALLRVDYVRDEVTLLLGQAGRGSGDIRMTTVGDEAFISYTQDPALEALWEALHLASVADF